MNNTLTVSLIVIIPALLLVIAIAIWFSGRNKRSQKLRDKFGPEYDLSMEKEGDKRKAEVALEEREKRVTGLDIRPLNDTERVRYHGDWTTVQADFVDNPSKSVTEANRLITEVMIIRGFPVADFEQRAADLSVMAPDFVSNYRSAQKIALKNQNNEATTEDLRQAMVNYRSLFDELLGKADVEKIESKEKDEVIQ